MKLLPAQLNEVIDLLIARYPNALPTNDFTMNDVYRKVGQQDVIKYLIGQLEVMEESNGSKTGKR